MAAESAIRFYFKRGRWRVTSDRRVVPAAAWWAAVAHVKCLNHKLRMQADASRPSHHQ